jgi:hypothetical protein
MEPSAQPSKPGNREELLHFVRLLCDSFADKAPLDQVLENFSSSKPDQICLLEHGLGQLAPFLGRHFEGLQGASEYFSILSKVLEYDNMSFSDYAVDVDERVVTVRGKATFTWKSTENSWEEFFIYRLQLDEDGKVLVYEVWADSGAAYLASRGELSSS